MRTVPALSLLVLGLLQSSSVARRACSPTPSQNHDRLSNSKPKYGAAIGDCSLHRLSSLRVVTKPSRPGRSETCLVGISAAPLTAAARFPYPNVTRDWNSRLGFVRLPISVHDQNTRDTSPLPSALHLLALYPAGPYAHHIVPTVGRSTSLLIPTTNFWSYVVFLCLGIWRSAQGCNSKTTPETKRAFSEKWQ